ncbi:MAG: hypothetical protein JL50_09185 [Peptococcaceae bacterium BICA1-7]|nr:MAG: hypothetical protein JL50_09185 [Peptococcaceae bacterium BICA1-7]HBV97235.1 hypothetical protein [Desulfotomaculum sp.]
MSFEIITRVSHDLSVDPSYIVRYQVFEDDCFLGDGVVQYHRQALHNDFVIPDLILQKNGNPLPKHIKERISQKITDAVKPYTGHQE